MARHALFEGLVVDENEQLVAAALIGEEAFYVVDDSGFKRHIPSEEVDRQVLKQMGEMLAGHEEAISEQTAKMLGQDDIFTRAMIEKQLENIDDQFSKVLESGLPEDSRAYLGMTGFRVRINYRGELLELQQPGMIDPDEE
ncbi:MAG: hypothetical protein DWG76_05795 [Chloroflexi bacterium]|nr:hypothetical protein [Chloroflexota bacterium]